MRISREIIFALIISICFTARLSAQSPYRLSWDRDGYVLGAGGIAVTTGFFLYRSVDAPTQGDFKSLTRGDVNRFDRSAIDQSSKSAETASNVLVAAAIAVPLCFIADPKTRDDWQTVTVLYAETWLWLGAGSLLSKGGIDRYRPYVYNPQAPLADKLTSDARMSFFSNHTAAAFASAVFCTTVYDDYFPNSDWTPYLRAGSLAAASMVGVLRYKAGQHFPTDVLAGAAIGSAIGYGIPWLHRTERNGLSIAPDMHGSTYGIALRYIL